MTTTQTLRLAALLLVPSLASLAHAQDPASTDVATQPLRDAAPPVLDESPHEQLAHPLSVAHEDRDVEVGFTPDEGAYVHTPDRAWSLRVGLLVQMRYQLSSTPDPAQESTFVVRMVRPALRGTVLAPWIRFFVQPELAGTSARLLDLEVDLVPHEAIGLRVGQFLTPFSRTFTTPVPRLLFPDFAQANDFFRADRDTGAMLHGAPFEGVLEYAVGVFDGNRIDHGGNDDERMMYMARVAVSPLGAVSADETPHLAAHTPFRFSIGANGYLGETTLVETTSDPMSGEPVTTRTLEENQTAGGDVQIRWETLVLQAEIYYRATHLADGTERDAIGGYAHAAWMFFWPWLDVAARVSVIDPDLASGADLQTVYEALVTFYALGNHLKLSLRYAAATSEHAQPMIAPGATVHTGTAQLQLQF